MASLAGTKDVLEDRTEKWGKGKAEAGENIVKEVNILTHFFSIIQSPKYFLFFNLQEKCFSKIYWAKIIQYSSQMMYWLQAN